MSQALKVAVTGGCGQIAYQLLFAMARGEVFGVNQQMDLNILEIPEALESMRGVVMELHDCAFPLLNSVNIYSDPYKAFEGVEYAFLIGSKPRGPNMERKDLLECNGKIFVDQGKALEESAEKDVKVFVVGNPCNTNCLIAMSQAKRLSRKNFYAMTRLDYNRGVYQIAKKAKVPIESVSHFVIWGNHSATQVPDFFQVKINNRPVTHFIDDKEWLFNFFVEKIQKRGAEIIKVRGKSSAASAASAIIDSVKSIIYPNKTWFSSGVCSDNNPYGIEENLIFSFPCTSDGKNHSIVKDIFLTPFLKERIKISEKELIEERDMVKFFIND